MHKGAIAKGPGILVDPVDRHPLLLVAHLIQRLHHLAERLIEVLVHDDHVEVFLILALDEAALLDGGDQVVVLFGRVIESECVKQCLGIQAEI